MTDTSSDATRRQLLATGAAAVVLPKSLFAETLKTGTHMENPAAFVYTELQISVPFENVPTARINEAIRAQSGFYNKTWLSGFGTGSAGGFYAFASVDDAKHFVTEYFPSEAKGFGVAQTTRIFDAAVTREASLGLQSVHYGTLPAREPGAFVYTEVQVNLPFENVPWAERNEVLAKQPGLISKTWLSGVNTNTVGGLDAFDTVENAQAFAIEAFPETAKKMGAAFYTRVFDASVTKAASREMHSPYYAA